MLPPCGSGSTGRSPSGGPDGRHRRCRRWTVANGQELLLTRRPDVQPVRVRGLQALGEPAERVTGVARVALNLRGVPTGVPQRGMALIEPGRWTLTAELDVRLTPRAAGLPDKFPPELLLHVGSARTQARLRLLGEDSGAVYLRLRLRDPLPLHVGDRVLLRDRGQPAWRSTAPSCWIRPRRRSAAAVRRPPRSRNWPAGRTGRPRRTCSAGIACCAPPPSPRWASPKRRRPSRGTGTRPRPLGPPARRIAHRGRRVHGQGRARGRHAPRRGPRRPEPPHPRPDSRPRHRPGRPGGSRAGPPPAGHHRRRLPAHCRGVRTGPR